ncbi:MAG: 4'-phosphopantetheinyl transferase superfamily protein, partial [Spirochaetota bacterium]|nr:4'-phosphopantetheinyl transferase superfamily protein [Spirochaetota bacterium]
MKYDPDIIFNTWKTPDQVPHTLFLTATPHSDDSKHTQGHRIENSPVLHSDMIHNLLRHHSFSVIDILPVNEEIPDQDRINSFQNLCKSLKEQVSHFGLWHLSFIRQHQSYLESFLTPEEKELYNKYPLELSRLRLLGGRILIKLLVESFLDRDTLQSLSHTDIAILRNPDGSPRLTILGKDYPGLHFSLSHKEDYVMAVMSKHSKVGVDLELLNQRARRISAKFLSDKERKTIIHSTPNEDHLPKRFTAAWSAKECLLKIYGGNLLTLA